MKTRILLFLVALLIGGSFAARAQDTTSCPIPCWKESFPYYFCSPTGLRHLLCSTDPANPPEPGYTAVWTHIPGCVNVTPINPALDYQPNSLPPAAESYLGEDYFISKYPAIDSFDLYAAFGGTEEHSIDSSELTTRFRLPPADPNLDTFNFPIREDPGPEPSCCQDVPPDCDDSNKCSQWENEEQWYYIYLGARDQYFSDLAAYAKIQAAYTQTWSDAQATQDAQDGLNSWLALCQLTGDPNCCIYIEPDNNIDFWQGNYDPAEGKVHFGLGYTHGVGTFCSDGLSCPDHNSRYITYNATNSFFYAKNDNQPHPDPSYTLYPSPFVGFYTGTVTPSGSVYTNYSDYSFREMVEHEIGHFLGMSHPEQKDEDSTTCPNNQTQCPNSLDHHMLMSDEGIGVDNPPFGIQPDDACMFQKLYCPGTGYDGVSATPQKPEPPGPEIYPNPTTGSCQLKYEVPNRAFVQVMIYDELGNQLRMVSSGYEEAERRTISLGTESLPSGNYVCRVRVGETVTYINVVVKR